MDKKYLEGLVSFAKKENLMNEPIDKVIKLYDKTK